MLIISRREGEEVVINENTVIKVLDFRRGAVRLGFKDLDKFSTVRRGEISYDQELQKKKGKS